MKILVIGKSGQVANELLATVPRSHEVICLGRNEVDITNIIDLQNKVTEYNPSVIINASAYTAVDKAESDIDNAYLINEQAVKNIAVVSKDINCKLIHISTDFIFDGESNQAYRIYDTPNPTGIYGSSKLAGERSLIDIYPVNSIIVRTSWVYSTYGNNFVKTMLKLMADKPQMNIVSDQIGCPTNAKDLACFIWKLVELKTFLPIYHWSDLGVASWYDFAIAIQNIAFDLGKLDTCIPLLPIKTSDYPTPAKRPKFSLLDCLGSQEIQKAKYWRESLIECIESL